MKTVLFTSASTGTLFPIVTPSGNDHAFIPNRLPPDWIFPNELWPKLAEAKEALGKLDGIGKTLPDPQLLLSPLKRQEAITSSRLEGTYATAEELMLFEISPRESKSKNDEANVWLEVANYTAALVEGATLLDGTSFNLLLFQTLHRILMRGVRGSHTNPGEWRAHQVAIGFDRRYIPPPHTEMLKCLEDLEKYLSNEGDPQYDPLVRAYIVHYQLEAIHPFGDGNGRIGRVLLSLMVYKWKKMSMPWLYMSSFFERFKDEYIKKMFEVSATGAWTEWIDFCLTGTIAQANDAIRRCESLCELRKSMLSTVRQIGNPRTEQIIEQLFSRPIVGVSELSKTLDVSYPTAQTYLESLVQMGILEILKEIKPKTYWSPKIWEIAYKETEF